MREYLLRVKRIYEDGTKHIEASICNAKQVCDFIEYLDLENNVEDYYIALIDDKNVNRLHKVYFTSIITNYEYGSHYRFICKGKPVYVDDNPENEPINYIDSSYYGHDH